MNALLINPWVTDFKLYDEWMHPVGLYLLGSLLKDKGWNIEYINCLQRDTELKAKRYNTGAFQSTILDTPQIFQDVERHYRQYGITKSFFLENLRTAKKPDIIFLTSGMTYWIDGLKETYKQIKKVFPETPITIGGISAQLMPDLLKNTFPEALIYEKQILNNDVLQLSENLTLEVNNHNRSLLSMLEIIGPMKHGPILTTLGCPYNCSYCASKLIQKKFFVRSTEIIFEEVRYMAEEQNVLDFSFYDDALLFKPENNFLPLAEKILQLNKTLRFHTPNGLHIKWIDKNVAETMEKAGFKTLRFGYESGDKRHKDYTGYKTEQKEIRDKVRILLKAGFPAKDIGIYVMGGLPDQTPQLMFEDIRFINSLGVKAKPVFISPVPNTPLYEFYKKRYPEIIKDPRIQNDIFFITKLNNWGSRSVKDIRRKILNLNRQTEVIHKQQF